MLCISGKKRVGVRVEKEGREWRGGRKRGGGGEEREGRGKEEERGEEEEWGVKKRKKRGKVRREKIRRGGGENGNCDCRIF